MNDAASVTRNDVEEFLFHEARLLDGWELTQWTSLLTDDARYLVPSLDVPEGDPATSLFLIADDRPRIDARVKQLNSPIAWAEHPRSRTRRLVSNVLITGRSGDLIQVEANFAVWRFKNGKTDVYVGSYHYSLALVDGELRIRSRCARLDMESLRPHGKLSFIL